MRRGKWSSFGNPECGITPGQLAIIAKIVDTSVSTYKERKAASDKYFVMLAEAAIKRGEKFSESTLEKIAKTKAELEAEAKGGTVERV